MEYIDGYTWLVLWSHSFRLIGVQIMSKAPIASLLSHQVACIVTLYSLGYSFGIGLIELCLVTGVELEKPHLGT